jgi:hypothetical protein
MAKRFDAWKNGMQHRDRERLYFGDCENADADVQDAAAARTTEQVENSQPSSGPD